MLVKGSLMSLQFLNLSPEESELSKARFVVVPVPFDSATSYKSGARDGPQQILLASPQLEFYDEETGTEPWKYGIHTINPVEPVLSFELMAQKIKQVVSTVLKEKKIPVLIGGDHSVSIGAIEAIAERYDKKINIIQFDAHTDLRDEYQGSAYSHACVIRRVWGLGNVIQVGIRSVPKEDIEFLASHDRPPIWARDVNEDRASALQRLISMLKPWPCYVTIDLDCFDPSIMPGVGTPEPGGLLWWDMLAFLKTIVRHSSVCGFDVVELCPLPGYHACEFTSARLIYKFLSYMTAKDEGYEI